MQPSYQADALRLALPPATWWPLDIPASLLVRRGRGIRTRPKPENAKGELQKIRDGPNTTTTIIFQKSFASDATPKRHLMAHQMKNLCGFSVFHCVEGAFGASSGGTPKMKNGAPRDELKNGHGRGWAVPKKKEGGEPQF